jgi:hypothetical protein
MGFGVDARKIARIWITPWEIDEGVYGVSYETTDGRQCDDRIGTRADAEAVVRRDAAPATQSPVGLRGGSDPH